MCLSYVAFIARRRGNFRLDDATSPDVSEVPDVPTALDIGATIDVTAETPMPAQASIPTESPVSPEMSRLVESGEMTKAEMNDALEMLRQFMPPDEGMKFFAPL